MWQEILVGIVVLVATVYTVWRIMPAAWRVRLGGTAGGCASSDGSSACQSCSSRSSGGCH